MGRICSNCSRLILLGYFCLIWRIMKQNVDHEQLLKSTSVPILDWTYGLKSCVTPLTGMFGLLFFSFNRVTAPHHTIEIYSRSDQQETDYPSHRFMLVADMQEMMVFSHRRETVGIYSNNYLLVKITAEHIHSDIYLTKYEQAASGVEYQAGEPCTRRAMPWFTTVTRNQSNDSRGTEVAASNLNPAGCQTTRK